MRRTSNVRKMTILAQDPSIRFGPGGPVAFAQVEIPAEILAHGPTGYRVRIVDYDASAQVMYKDLIARRNDDDDLGDPFLRADGESDSDYEARLLGDPNFHSQNCYAIIMRTLARFEKALGRRVGWSFEGHQVHVAPHAFALANAFYSEEDKGLFFGYFPDRTGAKMVFTCLSHDVVAHETTHALLDGLRTRFTEASGPDQGAFHEGLADIVALFSIFSLPEMVATALGADAGRRAPGEPIRLIHGDLLTEEKLRNSALFGLAEQVGKEMQQIHGALRRSINIEPDPGLLASPEYQEEHARGELIVAAMMRSFLGMWRQRIEGLGTFEGGNYNLDMVIEEGVKAADHLLTMSIRALDYCPPTDMDFGTYLAALLTADAELVPDDPHGYRDTLRRTFESYGIILPDTGCDQETGTWCRFDLGTEPAVPPGTVPEGTVALAPAKPRELVYSRTNFDSMLHDRDEVFRFLWENRAVLGISDRSPMEVDSVRSSTRQAPDGFFLRETIVTYVQIADIFGAATVSVLGTERPPGMSTRQRIRAFGGGVIVFDQYGQVKYHITHPLKDGPRQRRRLEYLMAHGGTAPQRGLRDRFAALHRARAEA
jgi:hypothetical protein